MRKPRPGKVRWPSEVTRSEHGILVPLCISLARGTRLGQILVGEAKNRIPNLPPTNSLIEGDEACEGFCTMLGPLSVLRARCW